MNILYLKIKELASEKGVSLAQIERDLNFSNGIISSWKSGKASQDKLSAIANYFNVSTDYLLGRPSSNNITDPLDLLSKGKFRKNDYTVEEQDELREELSNYLEFRAKLLDKKGSNGR